jgi:hypothetical protein
MFTFHLYIIDFLDILQGFLTYRHCFENKTTQTHDQCVFVCVCVCVCVCVRPFLYRARPGARMSGAIMCGAQISRRSNVGAQMLALKRHGTSIMEDPYFSKDRDEMGGG